MDKRLSELINDSELIIAGVGKEWNWIQKGIASDDRYHDLLEFCGRDGNEWLLPIVEFEYGFYNNDLNLEVRYLNEYDKQRIRTNLLRLCLMLMDGCQCIGDYFNYVESEQGVNRMLIEGQVNLAEAETRCRPITDLDTETPRWARTLKAALEPWLHNEADGIMPQTTLILRGFCLQ